MSTPAHANGDLSAENASYQDGFDTAALVNEFRANLYDALRDDFRLTADEADLATFEYLAHWITGPAFPTVPHTAVADAYARWVAAADPLVVAEREATQRVAGILADITEAENHLDAEVQGSNLALSNAYLQLAGATVKFQEATAARKAALPTPIGQITDNGEGR